jgi:hypothetical protein
MKKVLLSLALFLGAVAGAAVGFAGGVPPIPSSPTYSEASQIIGTLNALINQLNGLPAGSGGYAAQPGSVISLGSFCRVTGATPVTCTGQRGQITTTTLTTAASTAANYVITDSLITASNTCMASIVSYSGTFGTNGIPVINGATVGAGTITLSIGNANATNAFNGTVVVAFSCIN